MKTTYTGIELLQAIKDGKIKDNSAFKIKLKEYYDSRTLIYKDGELKTTFGNFDVLNRFLLDQDYTYELIEEDEIDIQSIEEIKHYNIISAIEGKTEENIDNELKIQSLKINDLIKAVKQLDREIKELKEAREERKQ